MMRVPLIESDGLPLYTFDSLLSSFKPYGVAGFGGRDFTELLEQGGDFPGSINKIYSLHQVHGDSLIAPENDGPNLLSNGSSRGKFLEELPLEADGWFLRISDHIGTGRGFAVKTADCLPAIILSRDYIALVHAGWRGLEKGILKRAVSLFDEVGDDVRAVYLGPAADPKLYEVGREFNDYFRREDFSPIEECDQCLYFDMYREAAFQMGECQLGDKVLTSTQSTMSSPQFYSRRREPKSVKRNFSLALFYA